MNTNLWLPVIVALIQISDAYLRYLSFKSGMTEEEKIVFWRRMWAFGAFAAFICALILNSGVSPFAYKLILMVGWIPYLLIFMVSVKRDIWSRPKFSPAGLLGVISRFCPL